MKKIICVIMVCLAICGCKSKAPSCSDDDVKKLVLEISKEKIDHSLGIGFIVGLESKGLSEPDAQKKYDDLMLGLRLEAIRTIEINKETGACRCAANLIIPIPTIMGNEIKGDIEYTSELTDKSDEFYVTVYGL